MICRALLVRLSFHIAILAAAFVASDARAAIVTLLPSKDNTLFESATGDESSGVGEFLFAGRTGPRNDLRIRRATLAFDFSALIPPDATITDVTLRLFLSQAG